MMKVSKRTLVPIVIVLLLLSAAALWYSRPVTLPDREVQHGETAVRTGEGKGKGPVSRLIGDGPMTGIHRLGKGLSQRVCQGAAEGETLELFQQGCSFRGGERQ